MKNKNVFTREDVLEIVSRIRHDVNNELSKISGQIELLKLASLESGGNQLSSDQQKYFELLKRSIKKTSEHLELTSTSVNITSGKNLQNSKPTFLNLLNDQIQRVSKVGGWRFDFSSKQLVWTEQMYTIQELDLNSTVTMEIWLDLFNMKVRAALVNLFDEAARNEKSWDVEIPYISAQGSKKWLRLIGNIEKLNNKPCALYGTLQDVSEKRFAQIELNRKRKLMDRILSQSPGMVYQYKMMANGEAHFTYVSSKAYEIYEMTELDFKAKPTLMLDSVHSEDKTDLLKAVEDSFINLTKFKWTGRLQNPSGKIKWIKASAAPHKNRDGSVIWDGVLLDITEEKNVELQLEKEKALRVQSSKLAVLGEMSAGVAHEINNPLAIIKGTLDLIKSENEQSFGLIKRVAVMNNSVDRISKIISGLKKFSRSTSVKTVVNCQLANLITEALQLLNHRIGKYDIKVKLDCSTDFYLQCDEVEMQQVIVNLINNSIDAIKYLNEKWINIICLIRKEYVVIQVIDAGPGLAPTAQEKVFQPFFTSKRVGEGTGLGLSVSRGIINEHGGRIRLMSGIKNTGFEISLPMRSEYEAKKSS